MSLIHKLHDITITGKANHHWYESDFYAQGSAQFGSWSIYVDLFIRKFRVFYPILHMWSTYTDNKLFDKPHKRRMSLKEKIQYEVFMTETTDQPLMELCSYREKRTLFYKMNCSNLRNGRDELLKADKYKAKDILSKAVLSLSAIHSKGKYHGDALLKNFWIGQTYDKTEEAQWIGFMHNTINMNICEKQILDFLTLILSHKKYAKCGQEEWWDLARWTITEIRGNVSDETAKNVLELLKQTSEKGIFAARRITPKERSQLTYYMESLRM